MTMRLYQLGDRVINLDAVAYIEYGETQYGRYCLLRFAGCSPREGITLSGDEADQFWALARHVALNITPERAVVTP